MKLVNATCSRCGAMLRIDASSKNAKCNYCGTPLLIDDNVQHIRYDNAEEAGYNFERGRQRAQMEASRRPAEPYRQPTKNYGFPLTNTNVQGSRRKKRSVIMLIASIIAIILCVSTWSYINSSMNNMSSMSSAEAVGTGIAMAMAMPHTVLSTLATIFCVLSWLFNFRWSALVAGILYAVAMVFMLPWFWLVIVQMILCFVGYAKMKSA